MNTPATFSHDWLICQLFPPPEYVVSGILPTGMTLLVGSPKAGKSWLALALAHAAATGSPILGNVPTGRPRPVFYAALEDGPQRLLNRIKTLTIDTPAPNLTYWLDAAGVMPALTAWMDEHAEAHPLAILDTLGRVAPPAQSGETDFQRDYRVGAALKTIADSAPGGSVVVVHHTRKAAANDFLDLVSGTQGLAGAADTIIVLRRTRNDATGSLAVTSRDAAEGEYAIEFDGGRWTLDGADLRDAAANLSERRATENLGERSADVVAFVNRNPEGVRAAEVAESLGIDASQARTYLSRLEQAGRIAKASRGVYTPVASVASVASGVSVATANATHATDATPVDGVASSEHATGEPSPTCRVCGAPLWAPESRARGICGKRDDAHREVAA